MRDLIRKLNHREGKTILISSHLLAEIEKVATHVGIIDHGKLLFQGTLTALQLLKTTHNYAEFEVNDAHHALRLVKRKYTASLESDTKIQIRNTDDKLVAEINKTLVEAGLEVYKLGLVKNDLEDLFLQILSEKQL
jgi:ABC-type multidrug transport system ATPase subunit